MENEQKADMRQMMFSVPLYFRATQGATNTAAGSHLFPAVLGNTAGGLIAGFTIQKRIAFFVPPFSSSRIPTDSTVSPALQFLPSSQSSTNTAPRAGRYKHLTILAALSSALIYLLFILLWKRHTGILDSFYIVPGGFGCGSKSFFPIPTPDPH